MTAASYPLLADAPARNRYERVKNAPGVVRVHAKACAYIAGKRCTCGGRSYRAEAYDRRTDKRAYKTFPELSQAKRWRTDMANAIADGRYRVTERRTVAAAWEQFVRRGDVQRLVDELDAAGRRPRRSRTSSTRCACSTAMSCDASA